MQSKSKKGEEKGNEESLVDTVQTGFVSFFEYFILGLICIIAFAVRLFAVVIHEYDPYFNYRTTKFLTFGGFFEFLNWFDNRSWYPLGRVVGGTIYPGLMATAAVMHYLLNFINISINVRNMCVFLAPIFASNCAIATYLLIKEATTRSNTALLGAAFIAIVPSYISRSVGGSYDNEGVAIFALIFCFYLWVKAVNTGSLFWSSMCALSYFYMVASWGGYIFIINIIPIYVLIMILAGRCGNRLYTAYSVFYVLGSLLAMQVPFVGFNVIQQAECAASHGIFILLQLYMFTSTLKEKLADKLFNTLVRLVFLIIIGFVGGGLIFLQLTGRTQWTGRSLTLLDPTYAKKYIPIIASVSEHQPTTWSSFFFDLHILVPVAPLGLYLLFDEVSDGTIFLILYGTLSWYFAGVMVRLMLTLAPAACILASVGFSAVLRKFSAIIKYNVQSTYKAMSRKEKKNSNNNNNNNNNSNNNDGSISNSENSSTLVATTVIGTMAFFMVLYGFHAVYVAAEAYSSPSIVLASRRSDGSRVILDDFREAYYWMRMNTDPNAKFMSWWDYGYQMAGMGNRTVIVDNNTWNNTHIATVGRAMSSAEDKAYPIIRSLDVDYVLVVFGGYSGYSSDDVNKFLWMVRIGGGVYPDEIQEPNYFADGQYRIDSGASETMKNCLMYKLSYYRFGEVRIHPSRPAGYDMVRQAEVGVKNIKLRYFDEAFTSEHWILRIFKVKKEENFIHTPQLEKKVSESYKIYNGRRNEEDNVKVKYVGCYTDENEFSNDKQYIGGASGANFELSKGDAVRMNKRYFAIAKAYSDGHSFVFNKLLSTPDRPKNNGGCERPCNDDRSKSCGCVDNLCSEGKPAGQDNNRRWAVYEIVPNGHKKRRN